MAAEKNCKDRAALPLDDEAGAFETCGQMSAWMVAKAESSLGKRPVGSPCAGTEQWKRLVHMIKGLNRISEEKVYVSAGADSGTAISDDTEDIVAFFAGDACAKGLRVLMDVAADALGLLLLSGKVDMMKPPKKKGARDGAIRTLPFDDTNDCPQKRSQRVFGKWCSACSGFFF